MSLKTKIEAVIYASEEPVTLAQLVGLLGHEARQNWTSKPPPNTPSRSMRARWTSKKPPKPTPP